MSISHRNKHCLYKIFLKLASADSIIPHQNRSAPRRRSGPHRTVRAAAGRFQRSEPSNFPPRRGGASDSAGSGLTPATLPLATGSVVKSPQRQIVRPWRRIPVSICVSSLSRPDGPEIAFCYEHFVIASCVSDILPGSETGSYGHGAYDLVSRWPYLFTMDAIRGAVQVQIILPGST